MVNYYNGSRLTRRCPKTLRPELFTVVSHDLEKRLRNEVTTYADNTKSFGLVQSGEDRKEHRRDKRQNNRSSKKEK